MTDPRRTEQGNFRHPLIETLFLVLSAAVCGITEYNDIVMYGEHNINWLRKYLTYENGIPSKDTLKRIFNSLEPEEFSNRFSEWAQGLTKGFDDKVVAIDGKAVRGINNRGGFGDNITIVSAFCSDYNICLGQEATDMKSNEITAIPRLLDSLFLRNSIVTIDAAGCQKSIARKIVEDKEADYVLALKANQDFLHCEAGYVFDEQEACDAHVSVERDSKQVVTRKCELIEDIATVYQREKWAGMRSVAKLTATREDKRTGEVSVQVRYFISSLQGVGAERFAKIVRSHWAVENKLHWCLDVVYGEDSAAKRKAIGARNFNVVAKMGLWFHSRHDHLNKGRGQQVSKRSKMRLALMDTEFREDTMGLDIT